MKFLFIIFLVFVTSSQAASMSASSAGESFMKEPGDRHMISFASGAASASKSESKDYDDSYTSGVYFALGYGYSVPAFKRVQLLGGVYNYYTDYDGGWNRSSSLEAGIAYNFSDELSDSAFISISYLVRTSDSDFDDERSSNSRGLTLGKRFNLGFLGMEFASYAPQIHLYYDEGAQYESKDIGLRLLNFSFFL